MQALRAALRDIIAERMIIDPAHDVAHLDRVWANAQRIAKAEGQVDLRVLLAAAYLHDLINVPKDSPRRAEASRLSAEAAVPILTELGFSEAEIEATRHAIAAHSFSAGIPPETSEAMILRDADRLDALGAIGIARTFSVSGTLGRMLYDAAAPFGEGRALDDTRYSIDHWKIKLLRLPEDMLTEEGRRLAQERAALMERYLAALAEEIGHPLPEDW